MALAGLLTVLSLAELHTSWAFERTTKPGPVLIHYLVVLLIGAALAWRRAQPLLVAPFIQIVVFLQPFLAAQPNTYGEVVILVIAAYSLGAHAPSWRSAAVPALVVLGLGFALSLRDEQDPIGTAVTSVLVFMGVLMTGAVVRRQRHRAEQMTRERDVAAAHAARVAVEERARIARELHDVVAHGMSVVILQARGGRKMIDQDGEAARVAFDDIERVSSDCLDEMRRLLGILRAEEGAQGAPLAPQPKLDELLGLVEQSRASGAAVELNVEGVRRELAPAIELSAYRITQEALTNALKHAPGSRTRVRVIYEDEAIAIEVTDDGPGAVPGSPGHGLIGMRERVELFGGTLLAGTQPSGGFRVLARLPIPGGA
jgi:signal transduction histidine kinase